MGVRRVVRKAALGLAGRRGIDLSRLDRVPDSLAWPLLRDGVAPSQRLLSGDPVTRLGGFLGMDVWLVTGTDAARTVLADPTAYSTDIRPYVGARGAAHIGGLGFTDPPDHTRLRKLLTPEFTRHRLAALQPRVEAVVERQLDLMATAEGPVDLATTFAFGVPFEVICELLGLPVEDRDTFRRLGSARFDVSAGAAGSLGAISGSREFLIAEVRRQRLDPGPGLIGRLVRDHGDEFDDLELGGLADGVFTGGMETSASMLATGVLVLLEHPEVWRGLASGESTVGAVVEELLRQLSVVQVAFPRFARHDVEVAGARVKAGDVVLVSLPAANGGDGFDPGRPPGPHVAFGHGLHRCVGAELARLELSVAFPALARRFPDLAVAGTPSFRERSIVFGVESLPVSLTG